MLGQFGFVGLLLIAGILLSAIIIGLPALLQKVGVIPHKPSAEKNTQYECGMQTIGKTWVQFNFHYYFYAVLFVLLDMLTIFLYPWAVNLKELNFGGLVAVGIFLFILLFGYLYAWRKGALQWK